jgi:hypothetical protein
LENAGNRQAIIPVGNLHIGGDSIDSSKVAEHQIQHAGFVLNDPNLGSPKVAPFTIPAQKSFLTARVQLTRNP